MTNINWGDYAILDKSKFFFKKMPGWYWIVKPVTGLLEIEYIKFLPSRDDAQKPWVEIAIRQIALTFGGTNIPAGTDSVEDGGTPVIDTSMTVENIEAIINAMPIDMILEIWRMVGRANPGTMWGPARVEDEEAPN